MNLQASSLPLLIIESMWFLEKVSMLTSLEFFQNNARPPPLLIRGTTNKLSISNFLLIFFSLTLSAHVSAINTTE